MVLIGKSSQEHLVKARVPLGSILDSNFSYYTLMTLSVILLSMLMILLSTFSKYDQAFDLWQQLELASELESYL